MTIPTILRLFGAGLASMGLLLSLSATAAPPKIAAEFPQKSEREWINSKPITLASLRGKVVLIDFWTFECWNCYRSFPWLNAIEAKYRDKGLAVIGVHTPEFDREKVISSIRDKVRQYGLTYPVMVDSDHSYWNAMGNQYWPAFYLIDREGKLRAIFAGETHAGDTQAQHVEKAIEQLLAS